MNLPKNEKTFTIDGIGETTGQKYFGNFTTICILNVGQKHQLEIERSRLSADLAYPSDRLRGFSLILATLNVKLIKKPDWWNDSFGGLDLLDENIVMDVYDKIVEAENEWREAVQKEGKKSQKILSEKDENEQNLQKT